jgi:FlgD Ig-like domain
MNRDGDFLRRALIAGFFGLAIGTATPENARTQETNGGLPGEWLSRYAGARTMGFGGAFVATADEPLGMLWNPAGLSTMYQNEVHFETASLFEDVAIHGFSFAMPARRLPSVGLTILSLRSGEFEQTNDLNEPQGVFRESGMAFIFSGSKAVSERASVGANVRVVRQTIGEFDGTGVGGDIGALYDLTSSLKLGASVLNLGGPNLTLRGTEEAFPIEVRGGVALSVLSGHGLVSVELDHRQDGGTTPHAGAEWWVHPSMALRMGYYDDAPAGGFSYQFLPDARFDYAASDHELGVTHRVGISYKFGGFFASSEADPPAFSPIGENSVTRFDLKAHTKAAAESWTLEIVNKSKHAVRQFSGRGAPPSHVMWDGKDESGMPLPDGHYRYQLVVVDNEGRTVTGHDRIVEITTSGPQGSVPVVIE